MGSHRFGSERLELSPYVEVVINCLLRDFELFRCFPAIKTFSADFWAIFNDSNVEKQVVKSFQVWSIRHWSEGNSYIDRNHFQKVFHASVTENQTLLLVSHGLCGGIMYQIPQPVPKLTFDKYLKATSLNSEICHSHQTLQDFVVLRLTPTPHPQLPLRLQTLRDWWLWRLATWLLEQTHRHSRRESFGPIVFWG